MANTGKKIVLTLKEQYVATGIATGNTKPNTIGDPDYIAPSTDLAACPVVNALTCPVLIASGTDAGKIEYEFSLPTSVADNPNVAKIKLYFKLGGITQMVLTILNNVAGKRFWTGNVTELTGGPYTIDVEYLNNADAVQATCVNVANTSINVS